MVSTAIALTNQFYEWERRGRGWHKADYTVDLEPPFYPFFGHFIEGGPIIDDGKQATWLSLIADAFKTPAATDATVEKEEKIQAYPNSDDAQLTIYQITLPRQFRQSAERMEQLLIMLSYRKSHISFETVASTESISLQLVCREPDAEFLYTQLHAFFPECTIIESDGDMVLEVFERELPLYTVDYGLAEEFMRPLATPNLDHEPLTALFGILTHLAEDEYVIVQILFTGTHNAWAESIMTAVHDDSGKGSFFFDTPEMPQLAKEKIARPLYGVAIRTMTVAYTLHDAATLLQHVSTALVHASTGSSNALVPLSTPDYTLEERLIDILLRVSHRVGMLLNSTELATFVHFPSIHSKKLRQTSNNTKAAPDVLIGHDYVLGSNTHQGIEKAVSISTSQRLRHLHLIGATGTGKSTLLHSLIMQDIEEGNGICVLDPHGDLIESIVSGIPASRIADTVLIDPSDSDYPIGFNILSTHSDLEKELLASDLVALFKRFSTSWGDQMNSVFANAIMAFVYNTKQYHLGDLRRFLIEQPYRNQILLTVTDPDIAYYWQKEFPILKSSSIGPILTRLDAFLRPRVIRNMVCQTKSLNFQELMDGKKIILVKLSQGLLGMENSFLLGALIVSKLQQTAMARQSQAHKDRIPFYCYIDEFHHFITPSMASILSGARKYALGLILAHQDMQQVSKYDSEIANSLLANAGTRICFRLGDTDAKRLQEGFSSFSADDLQNLPIGAAIARVNTADADFNLSVSPYNIDMVSSYKEDIVSHTRNTYSVPIPQATTPISESGQIKESPPVRKTKEPIPHKPTQDNTRLGQEHIREHRYLQTFVKAMAEAQGYKASVEVPTPDGHGQVDVLLEKDGHTIAIEICVTTSPQWELHNIKKCLAAGYSQVIVCTDQSAKHAAIQTRIVSELSSHEHAKVHVIARTELQALLASKLSPTPTETIVKGYRVKVNYEPNATRQDLLQSIVNASKKR